MPPPPAVPRTQERTPSPPAYGPLSLSVGPGIPSGANGADTSARAPSHADAGRRCRGRALQHARCPYAAPGPSQLASGLTGGRHRRGDRHRSTAPGRGVENGPQIPLGRAPAMWWETSGTAAPLDQATLVGPLHRSPAPHARGAWGATAHLRRRRRTRSPPRVRNPRRGTVASVAVPAITLWRNRCRPGPHAASGPPALLARAPLGPRPNATSGTTSSRHALAERHPAPRARFPSGPRRLPPRSQTTSAPASGTRPFPFLAKHPCRPRLHRTSATAPHGERPTHGRAAAWAGPAAPTPHQTASAQPAARRRACRSPLRQPPHQARRHPAPCRQPTDRGEAGRVGRVARPCCATCRLGPRAAAAGRRHDLHSGRRSRHAPRKRETSGTPTDRRGKQQVLAAPRHDRPHPRGSSPHGAASGESAVPSRPAGKATVRPMRLRSHLPSRRRASGVAALERTGVAQEG